MKSGGLLVLLPLLAFSLTLLRAANKPAGQSNDGDLTEKAKELDRQWLKAAGARDANFLQGFFADNFVEIHAGGGIMNKQMQIAEVTGSKTKIDEIHADDINVRYTSPDVAIVTDTTVIKGTALDKPITGTYRVLRVFVKQNGRWRAAGAGLTALPAAPGTPQ